MQAAEDGPRFDAPEGVNCYGSRRVWQRTTAKGPGVQLKERGAQNPSAGGAAVPGMVYERRDSVQPACPPIRKVSPAGPRACKKPTHAFEHWSEYSLELYDLFFMEHNENIRRDFRLFHTV